MDLFAPVQFCAQFGEIKKTFRDTLAIDEANGCKNRYFELASVNRMLAGKDVAKAADISLRVGNGQPIATQRGRCGQPFPRLQIQA